MANLFAITTVTEMLIAEKGSVTTVFTVTNTTSRPLRGIARIKPLGNTKLEWIKIEGETERDFPPAGTHQFTVGFNKPKSTPSSNTPQMAESFSFRLDAISASNPDEDFTEGSIVTVQILEEKAEQKKSFPWWILIVISVLLIVVVIVGYLILRDGDEETPQPQKVKVPKVTDKTYAEAERELAAKKLKAKRVPEAEPGKEADKVFKQIPEADADVVLETEVQLSVPDICNNDAGQCVWMGKYLLHNVGSAEGNGWSITPDIVPPGHFLYGPYFSLQDYGRGEYRAFWEIKVDDNSRDLNAVTIDVYTHLPAPNAYATQVIKANQFSYPNAPQQFTLDFVVTDPSLKYEFRVAYWRNVKVTVEKVGFQKK